MNFANAFTRVIGIEGGYTPPETDDPGGETKFGISKKAYPNLNIATITLDQAMTLYRQDYWVKCNCDALPSPLDAYVFDAAINQGPGTAAMMLQRTLGLTVDGVIGPQTVKAAISAGQEGAALFLADRALRYLASIDVARYGRGWMKRLFLISAR